MPSPLPNGAVMPSSEFTTSKSMCYVTDIFYQI